MFRRIHAFIPGLGCLLLLAGLAGRSLRAAGAARAHSTIHLTAVLASPTDIVLRWDDPVPGAAGHVVEYATEAKGDYVILAFLPPAENTYKHARLMPLTAFYYRVRPFYGPASNAVEAVLPPILSDAEYANGYGAPEDYSWAPPQSIPSQVAALKTSVRDSTGTNRAAPDDLTATYVSSTVSGFKFTWTSRAKDEDGYLLESKAEDGSDFAVCAVTPPGTNSFGWALVPPHRRAWFRVRPFYYGSSSNIVSQTTGAPPTDKPVGR